MNKIKLRKTCLGVIVILAIQFTLGAQNANFSWANKIGGTTYDSGNSIVLDSLGNTYITGHFGGTVDFDPSASTATLTSSGTSDVFVAKYNNLGNYIWAFKIGINMTPDYDKGTSITIDSIGNIYIAGTISSSADFDPSAAVATLLIPSGGGFIAKYNSNGNYIWAIATSAGNKIISDKKGNVYATGNFSGTADFNPSAGTATLTSNGGADISLAKYTTNGNYVWAFKIGSTNDDYSNDVTLDSIGNIYLTGQFKGTADFDPSTNTVNLISNGGADIFVSKYDNNGNLIFAKSIGGSGGDDIAYGVNIDRGGNLYFTGVFVSVVDFDPNAGISNITSTGGADMFICKLNNLGNYVWANKLGSTAFMEISYSITTDLNNDVYLTGMYDGTTDFDLGAGTATLVAKGSGDIFIAKYDTNGNYIWAKGIGNTYDDRGLCIVVDQFKNVYTTGFFGTTCDFDTGPGIFNLVSSGTAYDAFLYKMTQCAPINTTAINNQSICNGTNTTLIATSSSTVNWYATPTSTMALATGTVYTTPTLSTGTYTYYAEANTCTLSPSRTAITVTVNSLPAIFATTNNTLLCVGQTASLSVTGANTYTWSTSENNSTIAVSPTVQTTYTVAGTDANGCANTTTIVQDVSLCTGINIINNIVSISVYPNPFNSKVTIVNNGAKQMVQVMNVLGTVVYNTTVDAEKTVIDLSDQTKGIYFIKIGTVTKKIIKE